LATDPVAAERAVTISVHGLGATVRLADGTLAAVDALDVERHRPAYFASQRDRTEIDVVVDRGGRRPAARMAAPGAPPATQIVERADALQPGASSLTDPAFEAQIAAYLKSTEAWAPHDRPEPAERHFIRKRHRAASIEARSNGT